MNESGSGNSIKQFTYGEGKLATATRHNRLAELGDIVTTETNQYAGVGGLSHRDTVIGSTGAFNGAAFSFEQSWTTSGEPKTITYPATTQVGRTLTVGLEFTRGLLTHVYPCTISGSLCTATGEYGWMTYSADGRVSTVSHGNGVVDSMAPDPNGLPRPLSIGSGYGGSEYWWSGTYGYDGSGSIKRSDRSTVTHLDRTDYSYDVFGKLVRWNTAGDGGAYSWVARGYDTFGNYLYDAVGFCGAPLNGIGGTLRREQRSVRPDRRDDEPLRRPHL